MSKSAGSVKVAKKNNFSVL